MAELGRLGGLGRRRGPRTSHLALVVRCSMLPVPGQRRPESDPDADTAEAEPVIRPKRLQGWVGLWLRSAAAARGGACARVRETGLHAKWTLDTGWRDGGSVQRAAPRLEERYETINDDVCDGRRVEGGGDIRHAQLAACQRSSKQRERDAIMTQSMYVTTNVTMRNACGRALLAHEQRARVVGWKSGERHTAVRTSGALGAPACVYSEHILTKKTSKAADIRHERETTHSVTRDESVRDERREG
jgi:hypothetical protein